MTSFPSMLSNIPVCNEFSKRYARLPTGTANGDEANKLGKMPSSALTDNSLGMFLLSQQIVDRN